MAILEMLICGEISQNQSAQEMEKVYKKVASLLTPQAQQLKKKLRKVPLKVVAIMFIILRRSHVYPHCP